MKTLLFLFLFLPLAVSSAECTTSTLTIDGRTMTCITCCTSGKYCSTTCL